MAMTLTPANVEVVVSAASCREARVVRYAAEEMTNFLSRAFGSPVPIRTEIDPGKYSIVLGSNDWSVASGIDTTKLPRDGFVIKTREKSVFIAGRDDSPRQLLDTGPLFERATLFGVYEFLERYVGCRFYFPGELGEIVPKKTSVEVPALDEVCAPVWPERSISNSKGTWFDPSVNAEREFQKERFRLRTETLQVPCCHGQHKSKIVQRFGKTHPEYFYMNPKGERVVEDSETPHVHDAQLCHTSAVWDEIYADAKSYLSGEGPEVRGMIAGKHPPYRVMWDKQAGYGIYYDVMPNDGMKRCCCPTCAAAFSKAKDPANYANEVIWGRTAELGRRLKADGVGGYLTQMAYGAYRNVPEFELPDNIIVTVCNNGGWVQGDSAETDFARLRSWYEKVGKVKLYNNTGKFRAHATNIPDIPTTTPLAIGRFYNRASPYIRGAYFCGPADRFIYTAMNYYVFSRIAWNGHADVEAIMDEHYRLMYGAASAPMKAFFESVEHKWMTEVLGNVVETSLGTVNLIPSEFRLRTELYNANSLKPLVVLLDQAVAAVPVDSLEARRIALVRREYIDVVEEAARTFMSGLSVAEERVRRAAKPPKSLAIGFEPTTVSVARKDAGKPFAAVKIAADLKPGRRYRLSYFVKGENIIPLARRGGANVVVWRDEALDRAAVVCPSSGLTGTFDWVHQTAELRIPKRGGEAFRPEIDLRLIHATGTAQFDGLVIEEIPAPKKAKHPEGVKHED